MCVGNTHSRPKLLKAKGLDCLPPLVDGLVEGARARLPHRAAAVVRVVELAVELVDTAQGQAELAQHPHRVRRAHLVRLDAHGDVVVQDGP